MSESSEISMSSTNRRFIKTSKPSSQHLQTETTIVNELNEKTNVIDLILAGDTSSLSKKYHAYKINEKVNFQVRCTAVSNN